MHVWTTWCGMRPAHHVSVERRLLGFCPFFCFVLYKWNMLLPCKADSVTTSRLARGEPMGQLHPATPLWFCLCFRLWLVMLWRDKDAVYFASPRGRKKYLAWHFVFVMSIKPQKCVCSWRVVLFFSKRKGFESILGGRVSTRPIKKWKI